ncbi:MAG: thioredoxin family protein [Candidatus Levybacteria bacterium]|nr:thioredoxin family protein [Candidatus Levybacteria bacterium]
MKNPIIIFIVVLILALVGFGAYSLSQKSVSQQDSMMKDGSQDSMTKEEISSQDEDVMIRGKDSSRYVEYSKAVLDGTVSTRRVLYFYANWCPTCRPADASFKQNASKIPEDVTLIRVNYNDTDTDQEEKDLAKKYEITYQHTFVQIDSFGKEIVKWNGGQIDELLTNIK